MVVASAAENPISNRYRVTPRREFVTIAHTTIKQMRRPVTWYHTGQMPLKPPESEKQDYLCHLRYHPVTGLAVSSSEV